MTFLFNYISVNNSFIKATSCCGDHASDTTKYITRWIITIIK